MPATQPMSDELVGAYADPDDALHAVHALRAQGVGRIHVASPSGFPLVHDHDVDHGADSHAQPWIAFLGGLVGLSSAVALQVMTSKSLGLIVGGKPIVAWTAFGVIMFELTMLFAGAANFLALIVLTARARRQISKAARDRVSSERILVVVPLAGLSAPLRDAARAVLAGALSEVHS